MVNFIGVTIIAGATLVTLFLFIGLPLLIIFTGHSPKDPTFFVETSTVKAYNLTSDNRLFCIVNLGVRVENHNSKKYSFGFSGIDMEVRKGKHHKLADDALWGFNVGPAAAVLVDVEAVGLHVGLKRKIAAEVRADVVAGEGRVNLFMTGFVGSNYLDVTCKNVVVDFSRSTVKFQKVKCKVVVSSPSDG